jgi:hypothetical protein
MHGNDDSRSNCHDARIATEACGVGRSDGAQASRTHPTARLPRPSSGNGHQIHANVASLIEPCSGLLHPKARAPIHSSFGASKTMFVSHYPPCPTQLGVTLGHPSFKLIKDMGQQIMPSHGGKRGGNSQETGPGKGRPGTGMGGAAGLGASGLHGAHPHTIRRSGHVHAPRHAPSRRVSSERGRRLGVDPPAVGPT